MNSEVALQLPEDLVTRLATSERQRSAIDLSGCHTPDQGTEFQSDEKLLAQVREGSAGALSVLFRRHSRAVFNVAWRILRDEFEADDLRQEVFLYLFQRANLFDARKATALSWIIQVTYHRAIDRRRYLSFRHHYKVEELNEQWLSPVAAQLVIDQLDGRATLDKLKGELTAAQQQTLELHFFEGYSFKEIAEKISQPIGNVRHHYYRALDRLRSNVFSQKRS